MHTIEISTGEYLDRMSILDIKVVNISDLKQQAICRQEFEELFENFPFKENAELAYYYFLLYTINTKIWNLQERLHYEEGDPSTDYVKILALNDQRFKVKQKIDRLTRNELREQKSYGSRKCLVNGHLGMGDMYWMNGAVRYLSTIYDETVVLCKNHNVMNVRQMYKDDPTIKIWQVPCDIFDFQMSTMFPEHKVYSCGIAAGRGAENYPDSFYTDMGLDPKLRTVYFHHAHSEDSHYLLNKLPSKYIIVHDEKSNTNMDICGQLNIDGIPVLNINRNIYPEGHKYYDLAQEFRGKYLHYYIEPLIHATELHLVESSLACLAIHLPLEALTKKVYSASANFLSLGIFKEGKL